MYELPEPVPKHLDERLKAAHAVGRASRDAEVEGLKASYVCELDAVSNRNYELRKEVEALKPYKEWYDEAMAASNVAGFSGISAKETIDALAAEVEALRADAQRYRFLQNGAYVGIAPHPKPHEVWCLRLPNPKDAANLDQAIDAAMSAQEK